jgi:hypothetical protein
MVCQAPREFSWASRQVTIFFDVFAIVKLPQNGKQRQINGRPLTHDGNKLQPIYIPKYIHTHIFTPMRCKLSLIFATLYCLMLVASVLIWICYQIHSCLRNKLNNSSVIIRKDKIMFFSLSLSLSFMLKCDRNCQSYCCCCKWHFCQFKKFSFCTQHSIT